MNKAVKKTLEFILKHLNREQENYQVGKKNNLFEWEDLYEDFLTR